MLTALRFILLLFSRTVGKMKIAREGGLLKENTIIEPFNWKLALFLLKTVSLRRSKQGQSRKRNSSVTLYLRRFKLCRKKKKHLQ